MRTDEDNMICDLAEYYGIYDYKGLSVKLLITLIFGLRDDSRIKTKASGNDIPINTYLLGYIADSLAFIAWSKTESAKHNRNKPQSILESWKKNKDKKDYLSFNSVEEFEAARAKILKGV